MSDSGFGTAAVLATVRRWLALAVALGCGTAAALGQSNRASDLGLGKLLVASRNLSDPSFTQSVVLLIHYDKEGTVGLRINYRTKAPISSLLENLDTAKRGADPLYIGGPVEMTSVLALLRSSKKPDDQSPSVLGDVYLVSSKAALEKALTGSSGPGDLRVYLGYCGWAPGQLENEVTLGGWWIFDSTSTLVFDSYPDSIWSRLISRTERQIARRGHGGSHWEPNPLVSGAMGEDRADARAQRE